MKRRQRKLFLSDEAHELLREESARTLLSMSVVMELLIKKHLVPKPPSKPRRERFQLNV